MTSPRAASLFTLLLTAAVAAGQPGVVATPAAVRTTNGGLGYGGGLVPPPSGKLPDAVRLRLGSDKFREPNHISATALSPDGKQLAVCGGSQIIRLLDLQTGKEVRRIQIREYLHTNQLFWTPDGNHLVTTGYAGINLWDAKDGRLVRQTQNPNKQGGYNGMIHLSADGKFAAIGVQHQNGMVRVIDVTTGNQVSAVKPVQTASAFGAMSPKGDLVATWGQHYHRGVGRPEDEQQIARTIQLWDAREGKEKASLVSDINQVQSVRFSPDGAKVAAGGNGVIQMWDVATGKLERRFAGRTGQGAQLVFSPDGRLLSAAGQDGTVQSWETATGKRAGICEGPIGNVAGLQYRPDGQLLAWATNGNAIELWEVPSGKRLTPQGGHTAAVMSLQFSADNKTLVSCGNDGKVLRWDVATGKELDPFELKQSEARRRMYGYPRAYGGRTHFSPNGKYLVAAGYSGGTAVWDVDAGLELFALAGPHGYVDSSGIIAFSPDSTKLVALSRYYGRDQAIPIPIWDMETGLPTPALKGQKGDFTCAGFSTDGNILVTCAYSYPPQGGGQIAEAWAWDVNTGRTLSKVQLPQTQFHAVQFLDHRLYVPFRYGQNQPQKVFDAVTGGEVRPLEGTVMNQSPSQAVALSPDRRLLAYPVHGYDYDGRVNRAARKVLVWEVASGAVRHELTGFEGTITSLAFSRDGKTLATGCSDTTILLWDLAGKPEKVEALKPADLEELWKGLEGNDGRKAEEALRKLAARPVEAVPFLKEQLKPVPGMKPDPEKIAKMIADLDSPRYAVREAAMRDLERLGAHAREPVQEALKKPGLTPEVRERLEKLTDRVNKPDTGAEWVRPLRGVEALERAGTPEAMAHLQELAAGGDAPPTRMAKEALGRLKQ